MSLSGNPSTDPSASAPTLVQVPISSLNSLLTGDPASTMLSTSRLHVCMLSHFSHVQLFVTLWTVALPAPLSMGFFRQEYWSGLPFPPPGDLPDAEIEPMSLSFLHWQVGSLPLSH